MSTLISTGLTLVLLSLESGLASDRSHTHPTSKAIQDAEWVECEAGQDALTRNGFGDNSYFLWEGGIVPYEIDTSFNETNRGNIEEAIRDYNRIFEGCLTWKQRAEESVYIKFENSGTCFSKVGRAYWPFPVHQVIYLGKCVHLIGHIKHEMMHSLGFYHEHSRSDRDMFIEVQWDNILDGMAPQFETFRWTSAYGEPYDYNSILHYPANAFSKDRQDPNKLTIIPKNVAADAIGKRVNLSSTDIIKIKKLYKCNPYQDWKNDCSSDAECGFNEFCDSYIIGGQCRTLLPDGSLCLNNNQCLNQCSGGRCTSCTQDTHCNVTSEYCAYKYMPLVQNTCTSYCNGMCLFSSHCIGTCSTCDWLFRCS